MKYFLSIIGMVGAFFIIKYRESIGNSLGEYEWMHKVGGIYNIVAFIGILIFFWAIATITNTTDIFFAPIIMMMPVTRSSAVPVPDF